MAQDQDLTRVVAPSKGGWDMKHRFGLLLVVALMAAVAVAASIGSTGAPAGTGGKFVVVKPGQKVEIAFAAVPEPPFFGVFSTGAQRAIAMAIAMHPTIRGFPIQVNSVNTLCGDGVDNTGPATAIVANAQNTAVIGHLCSSGMRSALPIYEAAGVVTISGSATGDDLPTLGPTVFNRTIVRDGDGGQDWFDDVLALPSVGLWNQYQGAFPPATATTPFDAFYFDATTLLLDRLQQVSLVVGGNLVIGRTALALAVRVTRGFPGVTCTITLNPLTGNRNNDAGALTRCAG